MKQLLYAALLPILLLSAAGCNKADSASNFDAANSGTGGTGQGGSLARFTIVQSHLYVVDNQQLHTYSLATPAAPVRTSSLNVGMAVETIYPYKDKLFIGSQQAMYIYSLASPAAPVQVGQASHVRACDPVVANDELAYVTVRTGTGCGGVTNALLVYDVSNVLMPAQVWSVPLTNPSGLGLGLASNKRLYVCDGAAGLKIFSLSNPRQPVLFKTITGRTFTDVIVLDDLLVCGVEDGTALYTLGGSDSVEFAAMIGN